MRYLSIVWGVGALVLTANTLAYVPQSIQVPLPQVTAFEGFIHREYQKNQELARRNNQYIADNIALREGMRAIVSAPEKAKQNLVTRLGLVGHSYRYTNELPTTVFNLSHIIPFHLHAASQDETENSGPSTIDMFSSLEGYLDSGESHNIVVTKLKGRRFNIDFYGFEFKSDNLPKDTIINANDYEIMLDLGVYEY